MAVGKSHSNRYIFVAFTIRKKRDGNYLRPIVRAICIPKWLPIMKKPLPILKDDADAEAFVEMADLSQFDLSDLRTTQFEFGRKDHRITMRLPTPLLDAVKAAAARAGMPYQRFVRQALEKAVQGHD